MALESGLDSQQSVMVENFTAGVKKATGMRKDLGEQVDMALYISRRELGLVHTSVLESPHMALTRLGWRTPQPWWWRSSWPSSWRSERRNPRSCRTRRAS